MAPQSPHEASNPRCTKNIFALILLLARLSLRVDGLPTLGVLSGAPFTVFWGTIPVMKFLVAWKTHNPAVTIERFAKEGAKFDPAVKVLFSAHVVGEPRGVMLLETDQPALIHAAIIGWSPHLECQVVTVLEDAEVLSALALKK